MKKSNLIMGLLYVFIGAGCLVIALATETKIEGLLCGFAGAGIVPGFIRICQYYYWGSPKRKEKYEKLMENKRIEMGDELKTKVRNQAGN